MHGMRAGEDTSMQDPIKEESSRRIDNLILHASLFARRIDQETCGYVNVSSDVLFCDSLAGQKPDYMIFYYLARAVDFYM